MGSGPCDVANEEHITAALNSPPEYADEYAPLRVAAFSTKTRRVSPGNARELRTGRYRGTRHRPRGPPGNEDRAAGGGV
ncbi:hypothetical protein GCM10009544_04090 [Streptomyces stramineus]|uniref:Uncharacterized protein n=1 Tax=Streptomyces stramineus TaxID=173861 RepID=A0ABN0ZDR3_9ACTN